MVTIVTCGILECEVKKAVKNLKICLPVRVMPPQLHLHPSRLKEQLVHQLREIEGSKIVVYGNCFPGIDEVCKQYNAVRVQGGTCYELVAGERFYQLLKEEPGTYFLLPKLCEHFEELTSELEMEKTRKIFFKNYRRCIFLDTGIPCGRCREIAEKLELPYDRVYVGTEILEEKLRELIQIRDEKEK